jgi:hypothetical protein
MYDYNIGSIRKNISYINQINNINKQYENIINESIITKCLFERLFAPFDETPAFKMGIIDSEGKRIKQPETLEEKIKRYWNNQPCNVRHGQSEPGNHLADTRSSTLAWDLIFM